MDDLEIAFAGIARQARLIAAGELSSRELVELYLRRIERTQPTLNAFRTVFAERALLEADQADARRGAGAGRPLLGVPIAVKDDLDVAGEPTMLGTNAVDRPAAADAEVVRLLRVAGAVIIGKTNVPELCIWPFTETATFGVTRNPWDLQRAPGGSSGGSAAAVAAGLVGAALGSDGAGSIRIPAAWCGLFGLKPQRGRVSMAPRRSAWNGLSVNGVLTRRVADTALFHDVASGATDVDLDRAPPPDVSFATAGRDAAWALADRLLDEDPAGHPGEARRRRRARAARDGRAAALARSRAERVRPGLRARRGDGAHPTLRARCQRRREARSRTHSERNGERARWRASAR